jgi:hypothetical protein
LLEDCFRCDLALFKIMGSALGIDTIEKIQKKDEEEKGIMDSNRLNPQLVHDRTLQFLIHCRLQISPQMKHLISDRQQLS